jgi:hypothetical protein
MVVVVVAYFLQIVMLSAYAQAFLAIGDAGMDGFCISQEKIFELIHSGIGKHQGGIAFYHYGSGGNALMPFRFKEFEE